MVCWDSERIGFEAVCEKRIGLDISKDDDGYYEDSDTQHAWSAWKARALYADEKAQKKCKFCNGSGDIYNMSNQWAGACHNCEAGKKKQVGYLPERHTEERAVKGRKLIPDGYVLVPTSPSPEMIRAGAEGDSRFFDHAEFVYRAMIAAKK